MFKLGIPLLAIAVGCANIPMSSLNRTENKAYNDKIKIYFPKIQYAAGSKEDLAIADDILHGFPLRRDITYAEDGSVKSVNTHFDNLWGPKERANFPDWKEKYKELARQADQVYGNKDGKISPNEAGEVLSHEIEKAYPLNYHFGPK